MTEQEILAIERACERLILDFAYFSDHRKYESLGALFTVDGTMTRPSGVILAGRDAIVTSYQATPADRVTRHVCTNIRIDVESADRARATTYAVVYSNNGNPRVGEFEDEFRRTAEGWRIVSRIAGFVIGD
jgi:SnoaL-like protein